MDVSICLGAREGGAVVGEDECDVCSEITTMINPRAGSNFLPTAFMENDHSIDWTCIGDWVFPPATREGQLIFKIKLDARTRSPQALILQPSLSKRFMQLMSFPSASWENLSPGQLLLAPLTSPLVENIKSHPHFLPPGCLTCVSAVLPIPLPGLFSRTS
jgi:hypothetical protein